MQNWVKSSIMAVAPSSLRSDEALLGRRIRMNEAHIYSTEALITAIADGFQPKYLFFWGHQPRPNGQLGKQCFSQWWASSFEVNGILYPTAEHYMMAEKARLFGDEAAAEKI